jgi:hypothetical protein
MKLNKIPKFNKYPTLSYPYLKCNLSEFNFLNHTKYNFNTSYHNLPYDPYILDKTRQRRYANYNIRVSDSNLITINHTGKNTFSQNVSDSRKEKREFELIENPGDNFLIQYLDLATRLLLNNTRVKEISVDVHQVRQICYPKINSHNSAEGIHQDGADYIIPALVLNRFNIRGGVSSVYNNRKDQIYRTMLGEDEFIFQDDRVLYHYVTPIRYHLSDGFEEYGYRDLLGLDITILE